MSSWTAHQHRNPRSQEPGTDFYCPIGTPILAPDDGRVYGSGNSIVPATGRWIGLDLDNGMRFRAMHLSRMVTLGRTVKRGQVIGYSGSSGYGDEDWSWNPNTGGAHTHVTLWPTQVTKFGYNPATNLPYTVDFMNYVGGSSGGGSTPEGFLMALTDTQQAELYNGVSALYAAIFGPNGTVTSLPNAVNLPTAVETIRLAVASLQRYNFAGGADVKNGIGATESMFGLLLQQKAQIAALTSAVTALAPGSGLSEETLRAIIDDSVKTAFEGVIFDDPDVNVEEIAAAVRDEFRKDPLS